MTSGDRRAGPDDRTAAADDAPAPVPDRIVLVGFMAAGKSTVGRRLARRLGRRFVDLDEEVERRAGRPIPEIFRRDGEARFRELEAAVTRELDAAPADPAPADAAATEPYAADTASGAPPGAGLVVAAGGGWMARPELRDRWPGAVRVWLTVEPETVLQRVGDDIEGRPMLDPDDPLGSVRDLLAEREASYGRAELRVRTDGASPGEVVDRILAELTAGTP